MSVRQIHIYIEQERKKLKEQFRDYQGRINLIKKIWDNFQDLPSIIEENFSLNEVQLNAYKELGSRFSYTDEICEEVQSLIDRIFSLARGKTGTDMESLESVESEIVTDLLIGSFEKVETPKQQKSKIDKLAKALAVLWIFEKYNLIEEVCNIVRSYTESESTNNDKYPSPAIALMHAASIFKGTTKDSERALQIIKCVEDKFGKENYKVWISLSYLYYLLWDEYIDKLEVPEAIINQSEKLSSNSNYSHLLTATEYSKKAINWLESERKNPNCSSKHKYRQRAYYYALNNYVFFKTHTATAEYFLEDIAPVAEKLEHISRNADVWHEARFSDTLARFYYRAALLAESKPEFDYYLSEAIDYNATSIKNSKHNRNLYKTLKNSLARLKLKGFVYKKVAHR